MEKVSDTAEILKAHGLKNTSARKKILESFNRKSVALSYSYLEELHKKDLDRVTIYRTLKSFEQKGLIHEVIDDGNIVKYALCQDHCEEGHHHDSHLHFKCEVCEETICLDTPIPKVEVLKNFHINKVSLLAQGVCNNCAN